ncbi:unnamed protein product [Candida verbasci]|uniref:Essential protein Yae1 N-terminal domain-containing protein n=1 Tax=Candida verbasci TaxID=1227364 RepID=A0A9W4XEH0_9ASCO|nr:unnamed protein product [Candida verbasci]
MDQDATKRRKTDDKTTDISLDDVDEIDINLDTDEILNLEVENYEKGFKEGQLQSSRDELLEGKQYGYQTGFQRFLIVGYIQGLVEDWETKIDQYENVKSHLSQLRALIFNIPTVNDDKEVEIYEKNLLKARNKLRTIATVLKENWKINELDNLIKEVGGNLQVSEHLDEMW